LTAFLGYVLPYGQMSHWGYLNSLKYSIKNLIKNWYIFFIMFLFYKANIKYNGWKRIGPHNIDILSIIFGSLLGDGHGEKRPGGVGTRITFYQEETHVKYLLWLHNLISIKGYCNTSIPKITTRLGKKGKLRKVIRFNTWTYTSFNWIHDLWYHEGKKKVPSCIKDYLTPLALAIWIMDDGSKSCEGLKFNTNSFSYSDCLLLIKALYENFSLIASIQSAGFKNQYIIFIWKKSMPLLKNIVDPYVIPEMKYKIM